MSKFEIYKPEYNDGHPITVNAFDIEIAVEEYCDRHFSDWDYPEEFSICAREKGQDEWIEFNITVETRPHFVVTEIEAKGGE